MASCTAEKERERGGEEGREEGREGESVEVKIMTLT